MREAVDAKKAARILGLSPYTLRNWRNLGRGPKFVKQGSRVAYELDVLEAWKAANRCQNTQEARR